MVQSMKTTRLWSVHPYTGHYILHTFSPRFKYHAKKESRENIRIRRKRGCWENLCSRHMTAAHMNSWSLCLHSQNLHNINLAKNVALEEELLTKYKLYLRNYLQFTCSRRWRIIFLLTWPLVGSHVLVVSPRYRHILRELTVH